MSARRPTGEYRSFLHVFSLIEQERRDNPGVVMGDHFSYPWPVETAPDLGYIEAVYNLTQFKEWPRAWLAFWAEMALCCGDTCDLPMENEGEFSERFHLAARRGKAVPHLAAVKHGPYFILRPNLSPGGVANRIVGVKRQVRRDFAAKSGIKARDMAREHNKGAMTPLDPTWVTPFHIEITKRVLATFSPYLVNTKETLQCESSTSSRSHPICTEMAELST